MSPGKLAGLAGGGGGGGGGGATNGAPTKKKTISSCPNCDCEVPEDGNFCDNCGCRLGLSPQDAQPRSPSPPGVVQMKCLDCNELFEDGARFCEECGGELVPQTVKPKTWADDRLDSTQLPETTTKGFTKTRATRDEEDDDVYTSKPPNNANQNRSSQPLAAPSATSGGGGGGGASRPQFNKAPPPQQRQQQQQVVDESEYVDRSQCSVCNRYFATDVLDRHEDFCQRQKAKARKVFDSRKARMEGTESEGYIRVVAKNEKEEEKKRAAHLAAQSKWKQQSLEFRNTMRAARKVDAVLKAGGTAKDLPPPTYSDNSHLTPCPHCGRRFAAETAERHIPKCAMTVNKPKPPPKLRR
eukprot:GDKK01024030.1.p1 GENE.GDKK01024030.1~~GDKK01024030.1.p1  ORF type:complete len:355 (-),score=37.80 GDKK01024030.1:177-1241(-)